LKIEKTQADPKNIELFAYIMRVLLTMIVEQAIRNRNYQISKESILRELAEAITLEEYHDAVQIIKDHINSKITQRQLDLEAF